MAAAPAYREIKREILGDSLPIKQLITLIRRVAETKTNILVIGESGTGKELVARMIHEAGPLFDKPFIPVNCGAIPESLIESEMFGHKRGSFTGAVAEKMGLFEAAHTGTLFLDEVGELPLSMQVKLLRALQERVIRRVGGNDDIRVDVRVIAATNRDLEAAVAKGTFREDLYYRLNVILIRTPPLRERKSDIPLLATNFLKKCAAKYKKAVQSFSPGAIVAMQAYPWPGNVRELENMVERAVTLESSPEIQLSSLSPAVVAHAGGNQTSIPGEMSQAQIDGQGFLKVPAPDFRDGPLDLEKILGDVEKTYLLKAIEHAGGTKKKAADLLGITFRSLRYRLKKLGVIAGDPGDDSE